MKDQLAAARKLYARKVLIAYGAGALVFTIIALTPFRLPCISKLITDIPCPGCGLTRAFIMASQFNLWGAITMNILFLPLAVGMIAYFTCAVIDAFSDKRAIERFDSALSNKWIIAAAVILMLASGYYNIIRGI